MLNMAKRTPADEKTIKTLNEMIEADSLLGVSKLLSIERNTLRRVISGATIQPGTLALVRERTAAQAVS